MTSLMNLTTHAGWLHKRDILLIIALVALAATVRLVYIVGADDPFRDTLILDSEVYHLLAKDIATVSFFGDHVFFRAPLFPYLLALTYMTFGIGSKAIIVIQFLMGLGVVLLAYAIARANFGPVAARIVGVATALYPTLYFFESEIMPTTLTTFLSILSLWLLICYETRRKTRFLAFAGLALGMAALARPVILSFALLLIVWLWLIRGKSSLKSVLLRYALVIGTMFATILPITLHNYLIEPDLVLISSQGGANFFVGNGKYADGLTVAFPGSAEGMNKYEDHIWSASKTLAERKEGHRLTAAEVSAFWLDGTLHFMSRFPEQAIALYVKKIYYFLVGNTLSNNKDPDEGRNYAGLYSLFLWRFGLNFPYGIVVPLFLAGTVILLFRSKNKRWLLLLFTYSQIFATALFFICSRFRQPDIPIMIMIATFAGMYIYKSSVKRKWSEVGLFSLLILVLVLALNPPGSVASRRNFSVYHTNLAAALEKQDRYDQAIDQLNKALAVSPDAFNSWLLLGTTYARLGRFDDATSALDQAEHLWPGNTQVENLQAHVLYDKKDYVKALDRLQGAISRGTNDASLFMIAARSALALNMPDSAETYLKTMITRGQGSREAQMLLDSVAHNRE
jgi:tetratricopeptide (TPR) repeat protein